MARETLEPVNIGTDKLIGERLAHPAFGTIRASRVSGQASLFGSNVPHSGYVVIEICHATMYENGYDTRVYSSPGDLVASVALSEAQWVGLISRMNQGSGEPCTLQYVRDGDLKALPYITEAKKPEEKLEGLVDSMAQKNAENSQYWVDQIRAQIGGLPKGKLAEVNKALDCLMGYFKTNHSFAKQMLTEHKEKLVVEAKLEIDAHVKATVHTLGAQALAADPSKAKDALTGWQGAIEHITDLDVQDSE